MEKRRVAIVLKRYPHLSETFIAQEILALEKKGLALLIVSLKRPSGAVTHPINAEINSPVLSLPAAAEGELLFGLRALLQALPRGGFWRGLGYLLHDLMRSGKPVHVLRFYEALIFARAVPGDVKRLHVHFISGPGSFARYASALTGLPWSCSAHARDIWTTPEWDLRNKLGDLDWLTTCTMPGYNHLRSLAPGESKFDLIYHGLDLARFPAAERPKAVRDGTDPSAPVRLISVGRAVEKKGYDLLLDALAALPDDLHWRFDHIGDGVLLPELGRQAERLGISDQITWHGAQPQTAVLDAYRSADLFVLPCRVAKNNDRDGLPNVLMEAQSQGVACLSTAISAIPDLIIDGETGVLVGPEDAAELCRALDALIRDPEKRDRFGRAGDRRVRETFSHEPGIDMILEKLAALDDGTSAVP